MKKRLKLISSAFLVLALVCSIVITAFATDTTFTQRYVDSNTFTQVVSLRKSATSDRATLTLSNIYKADGSTSNYQYILAKATNQGSTISVRKGTTRDLSIPEGYRAVGSLIVLYARGNNPSLDCRISGTFNAY